MVDTPHPWTPEFMAQWVADRQAGSQCDTDKKTYVQPKTGLATYHWLWVLGHPGGEKDNFEFSDMRLTEVRKST